MANGQKKKGQSKPNVKADPTDATKPASENLQNGDLRTAIVEIMMNDDAVMQPLIDAVSDALVAKLLGSTVFMSSLADKLEANGALGCNSSTLENVRQDVYESCKMDIDKAAESTAALQAQIASMERTQQSLTDEIDELEQYSRRNCLVVHGLPENSDAAGNENTTEAFLKVAGSLGVHLDAGCIDRSHRMGRTSPESAGTRNPRPVIVKFTSYEPRRAVFTSKRKLKGTHIVITENLTRRRVDLLRKARDSPNVEASWTSDGRIVCLLTNGRKVTVTNACHLQGLKV